MTILRIALALMLCIPIGYLLLYLADKLMDMVMPQKRKKKNAKRSIHNNRRP